MQIESLTPNASNNENSWFGELFFSPSKYNLILSLSLSLSLFVSVFLSILSKDTILEVGGASVEDLDRKKDKNLMVPECKEVLKARRV